MTRATGFLLIALLSAGAASAQSTKEERCEASAAVVMEAVQARLDGMQKSRVRRALIRELDRTAGEMLADWIYGLPESELTPQVGETWKAQCLSQ
ncbi:hypothetical protein [Salipiger mucosus]|uniref:Uncharacterized protein n=1 Tax=Salipiger mucosus DSM 16094 TaxID=1123237 RepID=S9S5X5_9RHOB|nr:hypothetical protein [Salipiger mucosus]EPX85575.1 hypothetical protein Salmuc_04846 [Salipiger mucosus DSM 16094]